MIPGATAPHVAVHFCATKQSTTMTASPSPTLRRGSLSRERGQPGRCHAAIGNVSLVLCQSHHATRLDRLLLSVRGAAVGGHRVAVKRRLWSPALWLVRTTAFILSSVSLFAWRLGLLLRGHTTSLVVRGALGTGQPQQGSRVLFFGRSQDWSLLASMMLICPCLADA